MENENQSLTRCRELIERDLQWGDSQQWTKQDFENLSDKIFEKTQVRLSLSTLKRIWGKVRYESSPTTATLNALARYVGYENWRSFQTKNNSDEIHPIESTSLAEETSPIQPTKKPGYVRILAMTASVIAGLVIIFVIVTGISPIKGDPNSVVFHARKVSDDLPNSVVFTYDATGYDVDSVIIQQSWDPKRREKVSAKNKKHTSIYYTPGYFMAKLIVNEKILKEDIVFIKTDGWKAYIDNKPAIYIGKDEMKLSEGMGITSEIMRQKTGQSVFNDRVVTFANVREFEGLSGSSFTFEARLKNTATVEESPCRKTIITLLTKGGAIVVPLSAKGCISEINVLAPDGWIAGKENDLSGLGCDYNDFEYVKFQVDDDHFRIFLNDVLVIDRKQEYALDDIIGVRIGFEGAGVVKEVRLSNEEKVYLEDRF